MNDNVRNSQNDEIDLSEILLIIRKYLAIITIVTVIGAFVSYYYTKNYISPQYSVTASVIVDYNISETDEIDIDESSNSEKLASLYAVIAKSDAVLQMVRDELEDFDERGYFTKSAKTDYACIELKCAPWSSDAGKKYHSWQSIYDQDHL